MVAGSFQRTAQRMADRSQDSGVAGDALTPRASVRLSPLGWETNPQAVCHFQSHDRHARLRDGFNSGRNTPAVFMAKPLAMSPPPLKIHR
jgi:hypothetical protein